MSVKIRRLIEENCCKNFKITWLIFFIFCVLEGDERKENKSKNVIKRLSKNDKKLIIIGIMGVLVFGYLISNLWILFSHFPFWICTILIILILWFFMLSFFLIVNPLVFRNELG